MLFYNLILYNYIRRRTKYNLTTKSITIRDSLSSYLSSFLKSNKRLTLVNIILITYLRYYSKIIRLLIS